jgi:anti-anti-sigma factor
MTKPVFQIEQKQSALVLIPITNLRELEFDAIEEGAESVMQMLDDKHVKDVVLDFHNTDYYGSTALAFFVKLCKRVKSGGGTMAFCNVSPHEMEILRLTHLDTLWPIFPSLPEALRHLGVEE